MYYNDFKWTDENVAVMTEMLAKGRTSRQVADVLRCSRNAVIGKAGRLDLPRNRNKGSSQPRPRIVVSNGEPVLVEKPKPKYLDRVSVQKARRDRDAAGIAPTAIPYTPRSDITVPQDAKRVSLLELTDKICKWPMGDPQWESFHFCGSERSRGPYCGYHGRLAYGPGTESERKAVSVGRLVR